MKNKLLVILGPTAAGKSKLGILLAQKLGTQIISGDSMLVYRGMDIGTAKPGADELNLVRHHLIDILRPDENFNAALFQKEAARIITELNSRKLFPLLVGGTGLYIRSLLEGYDFSAPEADPALRARLESFADRFGDEALFARLRALSPEIASGIHPNNRRRVIRAIEAATLGKGISREKQRELVYDARVFGLYMDRDFLYAKINERVENMFAAGLVGEVLRLLDAGVDRRAAAMRGIGYKEVIEYIDGACTLPECMRLVARNTRRFAKRQLTWYRRMPYIKWLKADKSSDCEKLANIICENLWNG
ncbi:MAG: tRNA (adenosine(37)-N6)-dimethylallyltransferase MiaA [Acidaminococcales bacterium]|jgi:tRNA dimethylallyltransferase|nr:tRNA (adenosine(37)-N6)-dimethylallyltransferase MiaA [Acidaminococcales bacterium]